MNISKLLVPLTTVSLTEKLAERCSVDQLKVSLTWSGEGIIDMDRFSANRNTITPVLILPVWLLMPTPHGLDMDIARQASPPTSCSRPVVWPDVKQTTSRRQSKGLLALLNGKPMEQVVLACGQLNSNWPESLAGSPTKKD
jgi:hypothetical protein